MDTTEKDTTGNGASSESGDGSVSDNYWCQLARFSWTSTGASSRVFCCATDSTLVILWPCFSIPQIFFIAYSCRLLCLCVCGHQLCLRSASVNSLHIPVLVHKLQFHKPWMVLVASTSFEVCKVNSLQLLLLVQFPKPRLALVVSALFHVCEYE